MAAVDDDDDGVDVAFDRWERLAKVTTSDLPLEFDHSRALLERKPRQVGMGSSSLVNRIREAPPVEHSAPVELADCAVFVVEHRVIHTFVVLSCQLGMRGGIH